MDLTTTLAAGIISSLLAVALIEGYGFLRRRLAQRPLRQLLGSPRRVGIAVPDFPIRVSDRTGSLMALHDSLALAHVLEVCSRINAATVIASTSNRPNDLPREIIAIGGPVSNMTTKLHLSRYCPGFSAIEVDNYDPGFSASDQRFEESDDTTWGFIVRLGPEVTGRDGDVLLLWGATALATVAAAFYFATKPQDLTNIGTASIFVALNVSRHLGYRALPAQIVDVTARAFRRD